MGGFCLLVELHREGSAPAACTAGFLLKFAEACFCAADTEAQKELTVDKMAFVQRPLESLSLLAASAACQTAGSGLLV